MANYYNIDDILTEEEFVPVVFHKAANGVIIDPSSETNSVEQGAKVELPLWLAQELYLRQAVSISVPACFNQKVGDKTVEVLLLSAFKIRYKEILTKAYTAAYTAASKFLTLLTKEETNLYEAAQSSMAAFKKWRMGGPRLQRASVLGRKRKPIE
ncbi:hypothetical protein QQP08_004611 [Theobroma cacao]|nr:hypothetical protein QQP08_004611 [Theobroma cacao]